MSTAVIYLRLSAKSKGQKNAVNLDTQEADCRQLAADLGATVVATLTEYGESAFDRDNPDDRPRYAELCDMVRDKTVDVVIAWHTDRLWRDDLEKALFVRDAQRAGLALVVTKTARIDPANADDEFLLSILTAVAKKESADKRRRIKSKMAANAKAGKPGGGSFRPFGYEHDKVTIRESEAVVVREIATRLLDGSSVTSVARWANTTGMTATAGSPFTTGVIRTLATSPRYAGIRAVGQGVNAVVVNEHACWPAIIDRTTHDRLRTLLLDPARRTNRSARRYLLSGMVVCGKCDQPMVSRPRSGRLDESGTRSLRLYQCVTQPGRHEGCGRNSIRANQLEDHVGRVAVLRFAELAASGAFAPPADPVNDNISAELALIDNKLRQLGAAWASDLGTDDAAFHAARATLVERRGRVAAQVRRIVAQTPEFIVDYAADPARLAADWEAMEFDRKRTILQAMTGQVRIGGGIRQAQIPFDASRVDVLPKDVQPAA